MPLQAQGQARGSEEIWPSLKHHECTSGSTGCCSKYDRRENNSGGVAASSYCSGSVADEVADDTKMKIVTKRRQSVQLLCSQVRYTQMPSRLASAFAVELMW